MIQGVELKITSYQQIDQEIARIDKEATEAIKSGQAYVIETRVESIKKGYTPSQRGALHLWCDMCATALNDAGIPCRFISVFGDKEIEIPWNMILFKERVYKVVLHAMTGKGSTEEQTTIEPDAVANIIARQYHENGLACPPWPSFR